GMELFRQTRGTLGYAADDAAPYLDLLIARAHADPASALRYQSLFFDAAQSVVSLTTSRTVARLAARVGQGDSGSAALARNLDDAQRELTVKTARAQHMLVTPGYADKQRADDEAELARLGNEVRSLQQQLLAANPRYGQLVASAATLADLQKALNPGEIYVKTVLLARGGYVIAITPATVDIYSIPLSRAQADAAVLRLRHPFDARSTLPRFDVVAAHDLFATVFGPVIGKVAAARSLIYEPDGALVNLPAAVFVVDAASVDAYKGHVADFQKNREIDLYEGIAWLGRDRDVSLSVSATGFLQSRNFPVSRAARVFVGFGAPVVRDPRDPNLFALTTQGREGAALAACDQVRLKMVRALGRPIRGIDQTIREIGAGLGAGPDDIVLGAAFTDTGMQQDRDLANYRIVFFGTHGLLPGSEACLPEPALVTSLGIGGAVQSDALLDTSEILDLKLDAELVVLSACDTGGAGSAEADRTGLTGSGEALGGLARDFIYAGGRGLIVSQWEVDTNATLQLMKQLFQPGAASQGDALRRAERTLMDSRDFSHPFYWAGFSLVGDGARAMPTGQGK
ncbi:MAG TPA: CHAT domain-containing protein, partial [Rhizomicrobium sp.]